jgi:hypothetical protein
MLTGLVHPLCLIESSPLAFYLYDFIDCDSGSLVRDDN